MTKVDWKPWPNEKPTKSGDYIVTVRTVENPFTSFDYYRNEYQDWEGFENHEIEAWAEKPEPYKGESNEAE